MNILERSRQATQIRTNVLHRTTSNCPFLDYPSLQFKNEAYLNTIYMKMRYQLHANTNIVHMYDALSLSKLMKPLKQNISFWNTVRTIA